MDQKREVALTAFVQLGLVLWAGTEILSLFHALTRPWIALYWVTALAAIAVVNFRNLQFRLRFDPWVTLTCAAIVAILTCTALAAAFSPPNSSDAMAYHLPRVIYWAEQQSVRFFPTPYLNQIMLQPLAEYAMLHLYLLSGSDALSNFVQWGASVGSILGVSAIAAQMGATPRAQAVAALFCATTPSGILASSGAKNDYLLALWMICAVYFALRSRSVLLGMAIGCALLTKGTAYLYLPPLLLACWMFSPRPHRALAAVVPLLIALAMNVPHFVRNVDLSGSPLGFDSAQGDGLYRWRNDSFGWKPTVSNALRHTGEQLAARSEGWNQGVYDTITAIHGTLNIDPDDRASTWPDGHYAPPKNSNHETDAPNRIHLLILVFAACSLRTRLPLLYAAALVSGFLAACFYLKWQLFMGRLFLPLFVSAAPLVSLIRPQIALVAVAALTLDAARLPALQNWVRPLQGPRSVFTVPRIDQYFSDLTSWNNQAAYESAAADIVSTRCPTVGLDITNLQIEYPLIALIRAKNPDTSFVHTGTANASARYPQPVSSKPCAVVCLDCKNDARRLELYSGFPNSRTAGLFVVFWK